jgi:acyl dehydratase
VKIPSSIVGTSAGPRSHTIDARWLMAYAASIGDTAGAYLDTLSPDGIVAHPLFPVCYEWPVALEIRGKTLAEDVAIRSVHATHHLVLDRPPRPGDRLHTRATVTAVEPRRSGTLLLTRFETWDDHGEPVSSSEYGSLYRGVASDGPARSVEEAGGPSRSGEGPDRAAEARSVHDAPPAPAGEGFPRNASETVWTQEIPVSATLGHVYSECARIWNPIHTDRAVARQAGLPDIILHGTATLALAVSAVLRREAVDPRPVVRELSGRFAGMVFMPSRLTLRCTGGRPDARGRSIAFEVMSAEGRLAIRDGRLRLA